MGVRSAAGLMPLLLVALGAVAAQQNTVAQSPSALPAQQNTVAQPSSAVPAQQNAVAPPQRTLPALKQSAIEAGRGIYEQNCSPCHGARMADPQGAFDLRAFPHDDHERFVRSVTHGKNNMPPWGDLLTAEQIEALWAYVVAGESR